MEKMVKKKARSTKTLTICQNDLAIVSTSTRMPRTRRTARNARRILSAVKKGRGGVYV